MQIINIINIMEDTPSEPSQQLHPITLTDSHTHLTDYNDMQEVDDVLLKARSAGVKLILDNATKEDNWKQVLDISHKYPDLVVPSVGLHPYYLSASEIKKDWHMRMEDILKNNKKVQVGEIGLDFSKLEKASKEEQMNIFVQQLELAESRLKAY